MFKKLSTSKALSYLKASYKLIELEGKAIFQYRSGKIEIRDEKKRLVITQEAFLSLYSSSTFTILDESEEEVVDMKKDEEYYSWRQ